MPLLFVLDTDSPAPEPKTDRSAALESLTFNLELRPASH